MKYSNVCLLIGSIAIGFQAIAQPLPSGERVVSKEEYVGYLTGEIQVPNDLATFAVQSGTDQNNQEDSVGTLNMGGLQGVLLEGDAARATAHMFFIGKIVDDINYVGLENSVKIYARGFEISEQEATDLVTFIMDVNTDYSSLLLERNVRNCALFQQDLAAGENDVAIDNMARSLSALNEITIEYFGEVEGSLQASLPPHVYEVYNSRIETMQTNIRSTTVDSLAIIRNAGKDPLAHYTEMCSRAP